jgi:DNA (cytosine-5)-methyltransferase 1
VAIHQNQQGEARAGSVANTLNTNGNAGGRNAPLVAACCIPIHDKATRTRAANGLGIGRDGDPCPTLDAACNHAVAYTPSGFAQYREGVGTLKADGGDLGGGSETLAVFARQSNCEYTESEKGSCIQARDYKSATDLVLRGFAVRRLTPKECERLQGFTDGYTEYGNDGRRISDTRRYKALGNSVAVPCVEFIMGRIAETAGGAA